MSTRISASYPATDGSAPESVEVTWEDEHRQPSVDELVALIGALANVPRRYEPPFVDKAGDARRIVAQRFQDERGVDPDIAAQRILGDLAEAGFLPRAYVITGGADG